MTRVIYGGGRPPGQPWLGQLCVGNDAWYIRRRFDHLSLKGGGLIKCFFFLFFFFRHTSTFQLLDKLWSQVSSLLLPRFLPSIFIAHRVQQSHCSSFLHRVLLTHALALSASQIVHKKKSARIYTSMHSGGLELTKVTYTRLEDNLIRRRGDRMLHTPVRQMLIYDIKGSATR